MQLIIATLMIDVVEMEKNLLPFSLSSQDSPCLAEHGFDWSQLEHLSLYVNT